ncbi:DUF4352 domain-containing protein [Neobacillus drentensis]|uniref:DUF4352 domain-containing protein n=1 Tax=Neobacillus drentensis TaxID=220684 RepID=UPI002855672B|nr:DUF4352 domain-containing protein [Neobacillus drentensis]MDR7238469.1 hypothetical protein [Neobacillus drentensis]
MKQTLITILLVLLLTGCSFVSIQPNRDKTDSKTEKISTDSKKISEDDHNAYYNNPQVTDDSTLQKPGQSMTDEKGEATLKAIKPINSVYHLGEIEFTIKEMKLLHYRPDYSLIDYFHPLTEAEEFDFIKINVDINNKSKEKRNFAPVALFETNTGVKMDWKQDMYLEHLNGEIEGNQIKRGNLGFIVDQAESKKIEWIQILTSDVFNEKQERLEEAQKIQLHF